MPMTRLAAISFAAIAALGTVAVFADDLPVVDPAIATMTADQKVAARQAAMKGRRHAASRCQRRDRRRML